MSVFVWLIDFFCLFFFCVCESGCGYVCVCVCARVGVTTTCAEPEFGRIVFVGIQSSVPCFSPSLYPFLLFALSSLSLLLEALSPLHAAISSVCPLCPLGLDLCSACIALSFDASFPISLLLSFRFVLSPSLFFCCLLHLITNASSCFY